ncbi:MAG: UDP-N-acetylmuramate dehydrogenase [Eubacterium sp.]|nr:UDP-N-acetylmuramate dehydrogenase [Eubacterium sp.]
MSRHTTFRVGGPARYYLIPENTGEVRAAIDFADARQLPYMVVGKGSNLLFADREFHGVVIEIGDHFSDMSVHMDRKTAENFGNEPVDESENESVHSRPGTVVVVKSGLALSSMASRLAKLGLAGFEFAGGIPGTVGGAITMNAGAYGGEIRDCLREVTVMTETGELKTLSAEELELSYRHSILQEKNWIVLSGTFAFTPGNREEIQEKMRELNERRREKQPLEFASAGSTFKRPEGYFAGKLIEDAGLRGYHIGDAQVSEKHCGFVVNRGGATASEIHSLIKHVQRVVQERFDVELETEVKLIGDFSWDLDIF